MIEGIKSHENWSDDATIWNSAKAITRIVGMSAFTVVSDHEDFTIWDGRIDFAGGVLLWPVGSRFSGSSIGIEAVGVLVVIDGNFTIFYYYAFAWKSNNALDNILVLNRRIDATS